MVDDRRDRSNTTIQPFIQMLTGIGIGVLAWSSLAIACPGTDPNRLDFTRTESTSVLETSDGQRYDCGIDRTADPMVFEGITYDVVVRCTPALTLYTHWDGIDELVIERNGERQIYQAEFLGDRYTCDPTGETLIKPWIFRRGTETIHYTNSEYYPYRG